MSERAKSLRAKMRQAKANNSIGSEKQVIPSPIEANTPIKILPKRTVSYFKIQSDSESNSSDDSFDVDRKKKMTNDPIKEENEIDPLEFFNIPDLQTKVIPVNPIDTPLFKPQVLEPVKQIVLTEIQNSNDKSNRSKKDNDSDSELFSAGMTPNHALRPGGLNMLDFMFAKNKILNKTPIETAKSNGNGEDNKDSSNKLLGSLIRSDEKLLESIVKEGQENPEEAEELDLPIQDGHQRNKMLRRMTSARHNFCSMSRLNQGGAYLSEKINEKIEELRRCPNFNSEEAIQKILALIALPTYIIHDPDVQRVNEDEVNEAMPVYPDVKLNFSAFKLMK